MFEKAELRKTSFLGAHLEGAVFTGCSLDDALLKGAFYNEATIFPPDFDPNANQMIKS